MRRDIEPPRVEVHGAATAFLRSARVELRTGRADAIVRYTLDGSEPGPDSPIYREPITLDRSCTLRAVAELDGVPSPLPTTREFEAWTADNLIATVAASIAT